MDFSRVLQWIHAEGIRNGNKYRWSVLLDVDKELVEKFEQLANQRHDWDDS